MGKKNKENPKTLPSPFDKFMEDQLAREAVKQKRNEDAVKQGETPQQKYNRLYRERPQNRTVWRKK